MRASRHWLGRLVAVLLAGLLAMPAGHSGSAMAQQAVQSGSQTAPSTASDSGNAAGNAASPGAMVAESELPEAPLPASEEAQSGASQAPAPPSQDNTHRPVGTAAAPYEPVTGVAASRPAGAAIAPAKQRRVRTFLISLGVIAGAGIAVGSVVALSHGSPSRP